MTLTEFKALLAPVARHLADRPLDATLQSDLNRLFPAAGAEFQAIFSGCRSAVAEGWMCNRQAGGIRYGRVIKADPDLAGCSVDVVEMTDLAGPHHRHPHGEIDLIMPLTPGATFDGHASGWLVYGPDTSHSPTVAGGSALVLYLLPQGAIEFTKAEALTAGRPSSWNSARSMPVSVRRCCGSRRNTTRPTTSSNAIFRRGAPARRPT